MQQEAKNTPSICSVELHPAIASKLKKITRAYQHIYRYIKLDPLPLPETVPLTENVYHFIEDALGYLTDFQLLSILYPHFYVPRDSFDRPFVNAIPKFALSQGTYNISMLEFFLSNDLSISFYIVFDTPYFPSFFKSPLTTRITPINVTYGVPLNSEIFLHTLVSKSLQRRFPFSDKDTLLRFMSATTVFYILLFEALVNELPTVYQFFKNITTSPAYGEMLLEVEGYL